MAFLFHAAGLDPASIEAILYIIKKIIDISQYEWTAVLSAPNRLGAWWRAMLPVEDNVLFLFLYRKTGEGRQHEFVLSPFSCFSSFEAGGKLYIL